MQIIPVNTPPKVFDLSALDRAKLKPSTREKYRRALSAYLSGFGGSLSEHRVLAEYAGGLSASGRSHLKAGIRILAGEMSHDLKSQATPENVQMVQAALYRLEALTDTVKVEQAKGEKVHVWLSLAQVKELVDACDRETLAGRRDWIILALLVGTGMRRDELAGLTFDNVKVLPIEGRKRTVLEVTGKGGKTRVIPISDRLSDALASWKTETQGGKIARSLTKSAQLGESISGVGIFDVVRRYGEGIGVPDLAAHDLRRTYAQLGYEAGIPITQISKLLGHASIATTQKYLNLSLNLKMTISDFIPL